MLNLGDKARIRGLPVGGLLLTLVGGLVQKICQLSGHLLHELLENNNCALLQPLCLDMICKVNLTALTKIGHFISAKSQEPICRATVKGLSLDLIYLCPVLVYTQLLLPARVIFLVARVSRLVLVALISRLPLLAIRLSKGG